MTKEAKVEVPKVMLASEPWVMERIMDTEGRIEKAFHDQVKYLDQRQERYDEKIDNRFRWMSGLIVTSTVAIVLAILFRT